ncbi:alpha/beta fold hydrolase [Pseudaminobacter arsenicus]|uniref:Alpha/beta fold hydrolase n=1 Tax=Borborobacter arsenicus TaxID=1851146 RepID=A0A432V9G9_9HYPH|nr:alpha/beta hydrolase [Pseudaminobacter arsenicus]RUM98775.1 alpha/beta fold hydrolase [Pseudaminobacter arsenicus]
MMFRSLSVRLGIVAVLALMLAGCAGQNARELLVGSTVEAPAEAIAGRHQIFVATTRAKATDTREVYAGERSPTVSFAEVAMTVPAIHKAGAIERRKQSQRPDPTKYFTAEGITTFDSSDAFARSLRADIAARGGRALVFVHGYNTAFDSAVYRLTQIVHDANYAGTPVLFSWASGGRLSDYVYDNNSATAARDALEQTLRLVARSGAKRIDIIAHSMGTWATMEALRQLAITNDRDLHGKLGDVVLASPDIDVDVFKSQMKRYGKPDKPFFLFLSGDDRALELSRIIAGNKPRLGGYKDAADIASLGVTVIDLTNVAAGDRLNHTKFADNPALIALLGEKLAEDDTFDANRPQVGDRIGTLAGGITQTITSAAEIVITTPFEVLNVMVGGGN